VDRDFKCVIDVNTDIFKCVHIYKYACIHIYVYICVDRDFKCVIDIHTDIYKCIHTYIYIGGQGFQIRNRNKYRYT